MLARSPDAGAALERAEYVAAAARARRHRTELVDATDALRRSTRPAKLPAYLEEPILLVPT